MEKGFGHVPSGTFHVSGGRSCGGVGLLGRGMGLVRGRR